MTLLHRSRNCTDFFALNREKEAQLIGADLMALAKVLSAFKATGGGGGGRSAWIFFFAVRCLSHTLELCAAFQTLTSSLTRRDSGFKTTRRCR